VCVVKKLVTIRVDGMSARVDPPVAERDGFAPSKGLIQLGVGPVDDLVDGKIGSV
jgi:hypothetical protein